MGGPIVIAGLVGFRAQEFRQRGTAGPEHNLVSDRTILQSI
jgi:hypothetical protein